MLPLEDLIFAIGTKVRILRSLREREDQAEALPERQTLILELLDMRGPMSVSEISGYFPGVGDSTTSNDITTLWRDRKMVSKEFDDQDQRTHRVTLTRKGKQAVEALRMNRAESYKELLGAIVLTEKEREIFERILNNTLSLLDKHLEELRERG